MLFFAQCYPHIKFHPNRMNNTDFKVFKIFAPQIRQSLTIEARTFCMVSLDPKLSKLFIVLMSTRHPSSLQNGQTFSNYPKQKLETLFLQHESKIEDSLQFFPDNLENNVLICSKIGTQG